MNINEPPTFHPLSVGLRLLSNWHLKWNVHVTCWYSVHVCESVIQAYIQMVKLEQQRAEAERIREAEERKKKKEQAQRITRMLEAAFDGDTSEIKSILEEVKYTVYVHCTVNVLFLLTLVHAWEG